jgi:PIN domain nuclease of toxin-antitoxin system
LGLARSERGDRAGVLRLGRRGLRLLLDTNAVIWFVAEPETLRGDAHDAIVDAQSDVFVSPVAIWEISIKQAVGRLRAPANLLERLAQEGFAPLAITWDHALAAGELPRHHGDPFDRMLVAQAMIEGLTLISRDRVFVHYDVPLLPA